MNFKLKPGKFEKSIASKLNFEETLNMVCCPAASADFMPQKEYGAIFIHPESKEKIREAVYNYSKVCQLPSLFACDMESGPGNAIKGATKFSSMLACGKSQENSLAYQMGKAAALEGREVGFNWSFAPCVDILTNVLNPIVNIRSAGEKVDDIIATTKSYLKGMQDNGMAGTLKHFPGDGYSLTDQHLDTSINPLSKEEWQQSCGRIFKELIEAGAMAVMPGHIALPAYDNDKNPNGIPRPATVSPHILQSLLKKQLNFNGLIVSDAINMGGIANYKNYYDACALFFESGGDCLLFPRMDDFFYQEMRERVDNGMLSFETLKNRAARIINFKRKLKLINDKQLKKKLNINESRSAARQISNTAVKIKRDREKLLPVDLKNNSKIMHLIIANNFDEDQDIYTNFTKELHEICANTDEIIDPGPSKLFTELRQKNYNLVICSLGCKPEYGTNTVNLHGAVARNMMNGWMNLGVPIIFVNHFSPFADNDFIAATGTVINTYGSTRFSIKRLIEVIFGKTNTSRTMT